MRFKLAAFADEAGSSLSEQIAAMKENGISYLEIRNADGENIADISPQKAKYIKERLSSEGIYVWSLGSPFGKIKISDDFNAHLEKFKRGLETARVLGAKHIRIFSFYVPKGEADAFFDEIMERISRFVEASRGSGVTLCHENEKGIYGDIAPRCARIHENFPELRAVFDPANFIQCSQNTLAAWNMLSPYVEYMHIKDALPDGSIVPAGEGAGNLPALLKKFNGEILTLEPHLSVFDGLAALEADEKSNVGEYRYPSQRAAFDAAVSALKKLI